MAKQHSITKAFSLLFVVTCIEKALSFVYQAIIASAMGATGITDSYFAASEWFTLIDSTLLGALVVVLLNQYTEKMISGGRDSATELLSNVIGITMPIMLAISVVTFVFATPLSYMISPGFDDETRAILVRAFKVLSPVPVFATFATIYQVVLRYERKFVLVSLKSLFISAVGIAFVFATSRNVVKTADWLCVAYDISVLLYAVVTLVASSKYQIPKKATCIITPEIKVLLKLMIPLMISNGIARLALLIDRIIASTIGTGATSCLTYSHTLVNFVTAFFVTNLCTILLTDFTKMCAENNLSQLKVKTKEIVSTMLIILVPITIISMVCRDDIVSLVFQRGNFGVEETNIVSNMLLYYAIGFVPTMIANIYIQIFYAFGDTRIPLRNSIISIVANIVISMLLASKIGLSGIAIGTTISQIISVIMYRLSIGKHIEGYKGCIDVSFLLRLVPATAIGVGSALLIKEVVSIVWATFVLATALSFITFIIALLLLKEPIALKYLKKINGIIGRKL